ncbi:hypothetical protein [Solitalea lacus]|uniref:hypothetical protein n=1 Tax=Solitalea lacus TaxID=2911172 RepID=UPI001EDC5388|nr:hypothetical protein [Solitalea lacus]UKJ06116.1 hypothetical protein L2B55_11215 [Solitalea lacus]
MSNLSRKKFLFSGLSLAAVIAFFKWDNPPKKEKTTTAKFLTQDGKLVEIDIDKLPTTGKVATKEDVQNWVKK